MIDLGISSVHNHFLKKKITRPTKSQESCWNLITVFWFWTLNFQFKFVPTPVRFKVTSYNLTTIFLALNIYVSVTRDRLAPLVVFSLDVDNGTFTKALFGGYVP